MNDFSVGVSYNETGKILIELYIVFNDETDLSLSLVLEKDGEIVADRE